MTPRSETTTAPTSTHVTGAKKVSTKNCIFVCNSFVTSHRFGIVTIVPDVLREDCARVQN